MQAVLLLVHIVVCLAMIGIVLLQQGKGAEVGAVFGGSSQTLFGSSGATTFLGKLTTVVAVVFMLTSIGLTYMANHAYENSIMEDTYDAGVAPPQTSEAQLPVQEKAPAPMGGAVDVPSTEAGGDVQTEASHQQAAPQEAAAPEQEAAAPHEAQEAAAPEQGSQPEE